MTTISIIGGGRWARTIAGVICSLPTAPDRTTIHSRRNGAGIAAWIREKQLDDRLFTSTIWPELSPGPNKPDAVIVANQVADHFAAASAALRASIPVLIEKPMALTQDRVQQLCDLATETGSTLATSNVFLCARYFDSFAGFVAAQGPPRSLSFAWIDGQADVRHGETKSYDPRVSVFDDVLPHVVPMLNRLHRGNLSLTSLDVQAGGARVLIECRSNDVDIAVTLARNGDSRRRLIAVETPRGTCTLDFSDEPGLIHAPGIDGKNGDPLWDSALHPLGSMLTAFLANVRGGPLDQRLSPAKALVSAAFADVVRAKYLAHQEQWLEQRIGTLPDAPLTYVLQEFGLNADWPTIDDADALRASLTKLAPLLGA